MCVLYTEYDWSSQLQRIVGGFRRDYEVRVRGVDGMVRVRGQELGMHRV